MFLGELYGIRFNLQKHNSRITEFLSLRSGMKRASKFEASSQFRVVDSKVVPLGAVWKALPGWVVLARRHAEAIVRLDAKVRQGEIRRLRMVDDLGESRGV